MKPMSKIVKVLVGSLVLLLLSSSVRETVADVRGVNPAIGPNTVELLSYQAAGYRFQIIDLGTQPPPGFEQPGFDDSAFMTGTAAFGSEGGGCPLQETVHTVWRLNSELLLRNVILIPSGTTDVRVMISIDNDIMGVFFNGTSISGLVSHDFCPILDEFRFNVPQSLVQPGPNLVAFHVRDRGGLSFFDTRVLAEIRPSTSIIPENDGSPVSKETPEHNPTQSASPSASSTKKDPCPPESDGCTDCQPDDRKKQLPSEPGTGDPVNLNNLEFTCEETDLWIKGRDIHFELKRTYRSRVTYFGPFGWNWECNHFRRFMPHPTDPNIAILYDGGGRGNPYFIASDGTITSSNYHFSGVVKEPDGSIVIRHSNGATSKFHPLDGSLKAGRLAEVITKCQNRLTYQYDQDRLARILDSLSRAIDLFYENGRVVKVRDFIGREVLYTYDLAGHLIAVRSPVVTGTPNGNDFPNGKTCRYTYSSGFADEKLNHNLLSITAPNEVEVNGPPRVINTYDADDRLIKQVWGGSNASGVIAGGTITYTREVLNEGVDPTNPDLPREKTTVIDRNGNEKVFFYNNNHHLIRKEIKTRGVRPGDSPAFVWQYRYTSTGLLKEEILPLSNRIVREYDETNADQFQAGNLLSVTYLPDPTRVAVQPFRKVTSEYEPVYNQIWKVTEERGNDPSFVPQNGGTTSPARYTTEYVPDYFEGGLDTPCDCSPNATLRQLVDKWRIDISRVLSQLNQGDLNGDGKYSLCGNTILIRYPQVNLRPNSPQAQVEGGTVQIAEKRISYNKYGQRESDETPEGEISLYLYHPESDPDGDGIAQSGLNNAGQPFDTLTGGYLKEVITDFAHSPRYRGTVPPVQISNKFGLDQVGNVRFTVNPRGVRTEFFVNQLNKVVEATRAADVSQATETGLVAFGYRTRAFYDFNGNVVRGEVEYRDGNNPNLPLFIGTTKVYDILDNTIEIARQVSNTETVAVQLRYDPNENRIEIINPLAMAGIEPGNRIRMTYDEKDLLFETIRAPGTPDESKVSRRYDLNGNMIEERDAQDHNGDGLRDATTYVLDGFDRRIGILDAVGTETKFFLDPASNVIATEVWGPIGGPSRDTNSTVGNVLLAKAHALYDEMSRVFQRDSELFVPLGVITQRPVILNDGDLFPGDGKISRFTDYDRNSRVSFTIAPSPTGALEISKREYDGASRSVRSVDAENNEILTQYDKNSNPTKITRVDKNPTGRIAPETFVTLNVFDSLDRGVRSTDNLGHTRRNYFDSRDLLIKAADAQGPTLRRDPLFGGTINGDGNVIHIIHDGLGREIQTIRELRVDGQGEKELDLSNPANPDGKITETKVWDKNSRLASVADDKNNATSYQYNNRNLPVVTNFADGTSTIAIYDKDDNVFQFVDQNGNLVTNTLDAVNRLVQRKINRSILNGVKGTTLQAWEYDGLSRNTKATDNNDPDNPDDDSLVERKYDSVSRPLEETQNGKVISMNWREDDDQVDCTYPNGRKIAYTRDKLDRLKTIGSESATAPIAAYDYIGYRLLERTYSNGTRLTMLDDTGTVDEGYDGLARLVQMRHLGSGNTLLAGYRYAYNRENIKVFQQNLVHKLLSEAYQYDSVYRVVNFERGRLNTHRAVISGKAKQSQAWQLDGVGNWATTTVNGQAQTQSVNSMNEYENFAGTAQGHDENGNLTDNGTFKIGYDFANRPVDVRRKADGSLVALYGYDAFNRRFAKTVFPQAGQYLVRSFFYSGWRIVEERESTGTVGQPPGLERVVRQFTDGAGIDEHLSQDVYGSDGITIVKTLFYAESHRGDTVALTDQAGNVAVRLEYSAFGEVFEVNAQGEITPLQDLSLGVYYFQGRQLDEETGFYYYRHRYYDPKQGRFLQRDPSGYLDSLNLYAAFYNSPYVYSDAEGLQLFVFTPPLEDIIEFQATGKPYKVVVAAPRGAEYITVKGPPDIIMLKELIQNRLNPGVTLTPGSAALITIESGALDISPSTSGSPYGHTAIAIGNKVYSYEEHGWTPYSREDYLQAKSEKSYWLQGLKLQTHEEEILKSKLEGLESYYGYYFVNLLFGEEVVCSSATLAELSEALGIPINSPEFITPQKLRGLIKSLGLEAYETKWEPIPYAGEDLYRALGEELLYSK